MNEPTKSRNFLALVALVNAMIEYWKEIARRNFVKAHPQADPSEFEHHWPKALANFFLAETIRVAKSRGKETLKKLWDEIKQLPPEQRDLIRLSLDDENGNDLWSILVAADVITLPQLAADLGLSNEELMNLWDQTPMDSPTLANHLGTTRSQVVLQKMGGDIKGLPRTPIYAAIMKRFDTNLTCLWMSPLPTPSSGLEHLAEEPFGGSRVSFRAQHEIDRLSRRIDRAVEILPLTLDFDVGLIDAV